MELILAVLGSAGMFSLIQFLFTRHDKKHDALAEVRKSIDGLKADIKRLDEKGDQRAAVSCRVRILRFEDELQGGRRHSKDSFDQVMTDITTYDNYCEAHPDFKNSQTVATVAHIKKVYAERLEKRDFS